MNKKRDFENPEIEVIRFAEQDIITTSGGLIIEHEKNDGISLFTDWFDEN